MAGTALVLTGIAGILQRISQQDFAAWLVRRLLGKRLAERYFGRMIHGGWSSAALLAGAFFVVSGLVVTAAAIAQR